MAINRIGTGNEKKTSANPRTVFARACLTLLLVAATAAGFAPAEGSAAVESVSAASTPVNQTHIASTAHETADNPSRSDSPHRRGRDPDAGDASAREARGNSEDGLSASEKLQRELTGRYSNAALVRLVRTLSPDRAVSFYAETMNLIDGRHLQPTSYAARTRQGIENLLHAVGNHAFLQANGLSPTQQQVTSFRMNLARMANGFPVRTAGDARNMLYRAMGTAYRQLGVRPAAVATEFIYGAAASLDKYSTFLPQAVSGLPSASLDDHVVGIGVEIKEHESGVIVLRALRGGPAAEAGLQRGDVITSVDGRSLAGQSLDYAAELIGGEAGTPVLLTILRDGRRQAPRSLVRRRVEVHSVSEARMIDADARIAYIKLDKFAQSTSDEMDRALWDLYRQGMKSLVLDLRGNPGGLLTTAIEVSDKFLPEGAIVFTRGRNGSDNTAERATFERTWNVPLVVLIDEYSASASEIFAAAIQENERGLIVGRTSYGKGTVQTHFPLQSVSGNLKLTTAKFYSPKGREMAGAGVEPDVPVELADGQLAIVPLAEDRDVRAAIGAARTPRVQELASSHVRAPGGAGARRGS